MRFTRWLMRRDRGHNGGMAVLVKNTVVRVTCDDCPRFRCIVTEAEGSTNETPLVRVTGCADCEGSTMVTAAR